jgi:hypothetical protein
MAPQRAWMLELKACLRGSCVPKARRSSAVPSSMHKLTINFMPHDNSSRLKGFDASLDDLFPFNRLLFATIAHRSLFLFLTLHRTRANARGIVISGSCVCSRWLRTDLLAARTTAELNMHGDELGSPRYKLRYRHGWMIFVIAAECAKAGNMCRNMLKAMF